MASPPTSPQPHSPTRTSPRLIALLATFALATLLPTVALARTVAVLEFRSGARNAPRITKTFATRLARLTSHRVIPPSEARRILTSVDGDVAQCKGEASCIAAIGQELRCDEVVLVGISQLGDTILALQRIDSARGVVLARLADTLGNRRRITTRTLDGYLRRLFPAGDFKRYGKIAVRTNATGDRVFVDGQYRGQTPLPPLKVAAPGRYAIRVTRPGHDDFLARLDVHPDALVEVTPTLGRKHTPQRWYQKWWVWAIVGGVVVGSATTAVVLTTRGPDEVPAVVRFK